MNLRKLATSGLVVGVLALAGAACGTDDSDDSAASADTTEQESTTTTEIEDPTSTVEDWKASEDGLLTADWAYYSVGQMDALAAAAAEFDVSQVMSVALDTQLEYETTYKDVPEAFANAPDEVLSEEGQAGYAGVLAAMEAYSVGDIETGNQLLTESTQHINAAAARL